MMYDDLERTLIRELDDVASNLVVPEMPALPAMSGPSRWRTAAPFLAAAAVVVVVLATVVTVLTGGSPDRRDPAPAPSPTAPTASTDATDEGSLSRAMPLDPVDVGLDLYVGGEQVPGRWWLAQGRGTHWIAQRQDGSWWWGYDVQPQALEGDMEQPPVISPNGGYLARVLSEGGFAMLTGNDTEEAGEGFGGVDLPGYELSPLPRAIAVTDEGLVVAGGPSGQVLWRPLDDHKTIDLAETAPGQVVIGSTDAGLIVTEGNPEDLPDGTQGSPYLAEISADGVLTRVADVPTHDVLEASKEWLAYVPPGTVGGEASGATELQVQRLDGAGASVLSPPDGWLFVAPGFRWESGDRLIAKVVTRDGGDEGLVRCRPDPAECVLLELQ